MEVSISAPVSATEDPERVKSAICNLFPEAAVQAHPDRLEASAHSLDMFRELLKKQQIRDTARQVLRHARRDHHLAFALNKQAAYAGAVNFAVVGHPLGVIQVTVEAEDPEALIDWLTEI
ncbi:MAG TPA: coaE operon protein [Thermoplasmatales archaeon]|nr:RNA-binding domain-containing protein [Candidatus Thermoplasmatota archaeon]HDS59171.1 coaE operon protein [Thermoplasmatales archaeon]